MANKSEFQQILEEKLGFPEGEMPSSSTSRAEFTSENSLFDSFIASLRLDIHVEIENSKERVRAIYGVPQRQKATPKPLRREKTLLISQLKATALEALKTLAELGATELKSIELLSESLLKKNFRRLAIRLHPDRNPTASGRDFRRAHGAYTVLLSELKMAA